MMELASKLTKVYCSSNGPTKPAESFNAQNEFRLIGKKASERGSKMSTFRSSNVDIRFVNEGSIPMQQQHQTTFPPHNAMEFDKYKMLTASCY